LTYLLDTNVLSELRRPQRADPNVRRWAGQLDVEEAYISVISVLEIGRGAVMVSKKDPEHSARLLAWLYSDIVPNYQGRLLDIDLNVATQCARFGHVPDNHFADALLAATGILHGMTLVTRNIGDFRDFGVRLLNPWDHIP
jgi:predicted nucleic acid-binding protein